jgi:hypothetical protein
VRDGELGLVSASSWRSSVRRALRTAAMFSLEGDDSQVRAPTRDARRARIQRTKMLNIRPRRRRRLPMTRL